MSVLNGFRTLLNPAVTAKDDEAAAAEAEGVAAAANDEAAAATVEIEAEIESNAAVTGVASAVAIGEDQDPGETSTGNLATIRR